MILGKISSDIIDSVDLENQFKNTEKNILPKLNTLWFFVL